MDHHPAPPDQPRRWPLAAAMPPLGALPTAPRAARAYVRLTLAIWRLGDLSEVAEMIVSEQAQHQSRRSTGSPRC